MDDLNELAQRLAGVLAGKGRMLAVAESRTGGWVAKTLTDLAGSSAWFERGFISYHNRAKAEMLGVATHTLQQHGAVSEAVVREMVQGALTQSQADIAVAVTGVAGPGGGTADKPVGTVWIAWLRRDAEPHVQRCRFDGDREAVRAQTVARAFEGLLEALA